MPRQFTWLCTSGALTLLIHIAAAQAEATRPNDDQLVLGQARPTSTQQSGVANLAADRDNLELAVAVARATIEQGRKAADPRSYGEAEAALATWWNVSDPPQQVRILRAVIRQANHEFSRARADLDAVLAVSPRNAQALLSRAFLNLVTGDIAAAKSDCNVLPFGARGLIRNICLARAAALSGDGRAAQLLLHRALAADRQSPPALRSFAADVLADISVGLGQRNEAEQLYAAADRTQSADVATLGAYADFLLDMDRSAEALRLLDGRGEQDALLLRRAIAAKRLGDPRLESWRGVLNERFEAAAKAGNRVHLREEAMLRLDVEGDTALALKLAVQNWALQKEPADARLLLRAALSAGESAAAQPVADFIAATGLNDARVTPLIARLEQK